jgi:carboxylesterase type B
LDKTKKGHRCFQIVDGKSQDGTSEDCLNLNVFTPKVGNDLPVVVFIHGGSFIQGSGSDLLFDGPRIIDENSGSVIVTINYRLGVFGFLGSQEQQNEGSLNPGPLDQESAFNWVRVLFYQTSQTAQPTFNDISSKVGCSGADVLACLRKVDATKLNSVVSPFVQFAPMIDVKYITTQALDGLINTKMFSKIPIIVHTNENEGSNFPTFSKVTNTEKRPCSILLSALGDSFSQSQIDCFHGSELPEENRKE